MYTLAYKIRRLREFHNFTQQYMAEELGGLTQRAYSDIEAGRTSLKVAHLEIIAKILQCKPGDLFEKSVEEILTDQLSRSMRH